MNEIVTLQNDAVISEPFQNNSVIFELESLQSLCKQLMLTPHYSKIGEVGIFTILQKAQSMGLHPLDALNGAMYFCQAKSELPSSTPPQGKVELAASTMNFLIRKAGHSIQKHASSDHTVCILIGKRADNGDTMTVSFSIEDAKRAGIYRGTWLRYPEDMLFARALSRLARQLFPDVIKGCYVEGEISGLEKNLESTTQEEIVQLIDKQQAEQLASIIDECNEEVKKNFFSFLERQKITSLEQIPLSIYPKIKTVAIKRRSEHLACQGV